MSKEAGRVIFVIVKEDETVLAIKNVLFQKTGMEVDSMTLIFNGVTLEDDEIIAESGMTSGDTLRVISKLVGGY